MTRLRLTTLLLFFATFSWGQNLQYGIKGGVNFSSLHNQGSDFDIYERRVGPRIGGFVQLGMAEKYGFKIEAIHSTEGATFEGSDIFIKLTRLSVPLLLNYDLSEHVRFEIGPELKFQLDFDSNGDPALNGLESNYQTLDYGATVGLEIKPHRKIGFSLRNYFGIKYHSQILLFDELANPIDEIKSDRNNVLSLSLNYYLK